MQLKVPNVNIEQMSWYGRGPFENYPDRKHGAAMGVYKATIAEQHVPYIRPQENGNKCDVQWVEFMDLQSFGFEDRRKFPEYLRTRVYTAKFN